MKQAKIARYAYAAGIVDGEGSFVVSYRQRDCKDGYSRNSFESKISVSQKDGRIVDWLYGVFGGFITIQRRYINKSEIYQMYQWVIDNRKAYEFAKKIYPFLRYKKDQCLLFIRLSERKITGEKQRHINGRFQELSSIESQKRFELITEIKKLKHQWKKSVVLETKRVNSLLNEKR